MRRWLPSPLLSLAVLLLWLLLVADASAGSWLLGATLAVLLPLAGGVLQPQRARFGKLWPALVLARRVLWDIVLSNIEVARRILGPESAIQPGLVWVPLDLRDIHAITALPVTIASRVRTENLASPAGALHPCTTGGVGCGVGSGVLGNAIGVEAGPATAVRNSVSFSGLMNSQP